MSSGRTGWFLGAAVVLLSGCGGIFHRGPGSELAVPRGSALERDIAAGYEKYRPSLEAWGRWTPDPLYAMRWCPRGVDPSSFVPYRSAGHWAAGVAPASGGPAGNDSRGAPRWVGDDAEPWQEVTMHHGWWVRLDGSRSASEWCWIPGAEPTAARVVWRVADGYVGWAPEPPTTEADEEVDADSLDWTFSLLGTLLGDVVDALSGGAADAAADATAPARYPQPGRPRRLGPSQLAVANARSALSQYSAAHPTVAVTATPHPLASPAAFTEAEHSTTAEALAPSTATRSTTASSHGASAVTPSDSLPPAMAIYEQMMRDPLIGTPGFVGSPYLPLPPSMLSGPLGTAGSVSSKRSTAAYAPPSTSSASHGKSSSGHSGSSSSSSSSHKK